MIDNPLKWLLAQLPDYIEPAQLSELMARYEANKAAYARQIKIGDIKRRVAWCMFKQDTEAAARWKAKLDTLTQ